MKVIPWFERDLAFDKPVEMLPFYIERLSGTALRLEAKIKNIADEILSTRLNNKWSVKENIGHLAEVDEVACKRIGEMVSGASTMSPAVFEPKQDYNAQSVSEVIEYFRRSRIKNLSLYQSLSPDDLSKSSLHPRLKVQMTPVDLAWFDAEHDDHHLVKINEILKALTN
jgi:hypothetical protein